MTSWVQAATPVMRSRRSSRVDDTVVALPVQLRLEWTQRRCAQRLARCVSCVSRVGCELSARPSSLRTEVRAAHARDTCASAHVGSRASSCSVGCARALIPPSGPWAPSRSVYEASAPTMAFTSRNSRRPYSPHSRPLPERLKPPKGMFMPELAPLMVTRPARIRRATRLA